MATKSGESHLLLGLAASSFGVRGPHGHSTVTFVIGGSSRASGFSLSSAASGMLTLTGASDSSLTLTGVDSEVLTLTPR